MKTFLLSLTTAALVFGSVAGVRSQIAPPAPKVTFYPAKAKLQEMKGRNDAIISQQKATLQKLDELQKTAEQMKIFARRS